MITVEEGFRNYLKRVKLEDLLTDSIQYIELKRAFYAGFGTALIEIDEASCNKSEDEAVKVLKGFYEEVGEFYNKEIKKKKASNLADILPVDQFTCD